jgi:Family of unknown function (DUF6502)
VPARSPCSQEAACRRILDPLASLFLRLGVGAGEFATLCKISYVQAAAEMNRLANGRVNRSRIAVVTGLTRPEVARLLAPKTSRVTQRVWHRHRAARVLDGWYSDPAFKGKRSQPIALPLKGSRSSFEALVRKYAGDIPVKAVLQVLSDASAISTTRAGLVRAKRRQIAWRQYHPQAVEEIGKKAERYLRVLLHNLEHPDDRWYEDGVSQKRISTAVVPYLRNEFAARGDALLQMISDQLNRPHRDVKMRKAQRVTLGFNLFLHLLPERPTHGRSLNRN